MARGHWRATWEASPGLHARHRAKPEGRRQYKTTQPHRPQRPPSHNVRSPRWAPRRKREGGPQRKEAPLPAADLTAQGPPRPEIPSGLMDLPNKQRTSTPANRPPDVTARESSEAPDASQPSTGGGRPTPNAKHAAGPTPPTAHGAETAGHADAAPSTAPARRSDARAPGDATSGEASTWDPPEAHEESEDRATTPDTPKRDEDSLDAFMEYCRSAPNTDPAPRNHLEPRGNHTGGTLHSMSHQAHPWRDYATVGVRTEHTAATDDGRATTSGAADQTPDEPPRHIA